MARFPSMYKNDPQFSRLVSFVPQALVEFYEDGNKRDQFCDYSHLTSEEAGTLMTNPLSDPFIDIKNLRINTSGLKAVGRFDPDLHRRVAIDIDIARQFQQDYDLSIARETILAVILHECVHFGRHKKNVPDPDLPEGGIEFEFAIWGTHHGLWFDNPSPDLAVADNSMFVFPVTGETGRRNHLYGRGVRNGGKRDHHGIDLFHSGVGHPPVYAAADGIVLGADRFREGTSRRTEINNYGQMIDLNHGNGLTTRYAHLESIEVAPKQQVKQGQRIGTLGSTGTTRGNAIEIGMPIPPGSALPHLHFEVRKSEGNAFGDFASTLDPLTFFPFLMEDPENRLVRALTPGKSMDNPAVLLGA